MLDIHCHILPGIDDGAGDLETSIKMLRIAEKNGTHKIFATPHYYSGYYENSYEDILKQVESLNSEAKLQGIEIEILPGQEVFVDNHTLDLYNKGIIRGLNNSKYMLIEFPMDVLPDDALDIIYELKLLGVKPIIAHPERYMYIVNSLTNINQFIKEGCLFQINSSSITGLFGKKIEETAFKLIDNGICQFIASDAHSTGRRCPGIDKALELIKKRDRVLARSIIKNAERVMNNEEIYTDMKEVEEKKGLFSFLFKK